MFERRARLARLAWGHALLYAPLLAAHAACGGALPAEARATAAAAAREARLALGAAADRARGARRARRSRTAGARRAGADAGLRAARVGRPLRRGRARAAVALAPAWLWRAWIAPRVLGFPAGADAPETPGEMDARAGVDGAGVLEALEAACARRRPRRSRRCGARSGTCGSARAADAARLFEAAGRPRAVSCARGARSGVASRRPSR